MITQTAFRTAHKISRTAERSIKNKSADRLVFSAKTRHGSHSETKKKGEPGNYGSAPVESPGEITANGVGRVQQRRGTVKQEMAMAPMVVACQILRKEKECSCGIGKAILSAMLMRVYGWNSMQRRWLIRQWKESVLCGWGPLTRERQSKISNYEHRWWAWHAPCMPSP